MREYHKLTEAVLDHYRQQDITIEEIDGLGTPDEVFQRIKTVLAGLSSRET
jgi:adenylate kinase family enzyme